MQASTHCLDIKVENDLPQISTVIQDSIENVPSLLDDLATDESNCSFTPCYLDIQQEDNLSIDIIQLYYELLPSKESHDRRIKFVKLMEKILNSEWPEHDIKANVFGSSVNDLGTSSSDVDLCITTPWSGLRNVRILAKLFRKCGMQHIVCVPRAKVPIVRLFDPELQLSCDINVNNTIALQNTKMIKTYVALDPRVRPLIMIIKHWTKQRSLNDAANGGTLSSYTWTCMIINFLQQRHPPILPVLHSIENEDKDENYFFDNVDKLKGFGAENHESLGGLLFAFFRRYAIEFDYDEQVISVRHGRYLSKHEKGWDTGRNKMSLCVEEPFNVGRNLGNSADVTSVYGLRCEFQRSLDLLLAGESLDALCRPYQSLSLAHTTEIPSSNNNSSSHTDVLSLTLPTENRNSLFFLSQPYPDSTHPYDRRRSMVDGICSYPSPIHISTLRSSPASKMSHSPSFHPRFSSPQALDSILKVRNTRHGSHPLPPVPSTLLSMLNISANHGTDQSVDKILARYHKNPPSSKLQSKQQATIESKPVKKTTGNHYRRTKGHASNHHHYHQKQRRRSSGIEWPSISKNSATPPPPPPPPLMETPVVWVTDQPQRSRRWSTTKTPDPLTVVEPKKKTLAEIVKVHTPPMIKQKTPPDSPIPSTSRNTKTNSKRQKSSNIKSVNNNHRQQKKKNTKSRN